MPVGPTSLIAAVLLWPLHGDVIEQFRFDHRHPFDRGQHRGIDIAARPGAAVRSACPGRVTFAGRLPRGGRAVSVRCGDLTITYLHLSATAVHRGASLRAGTRIATAGAALHLGVRRTADRFGYLDPLSLLAEPSEPPPAPAPLLRRPPPRPPTVHVGPALPRVPTVAWAGAGLLVLGAPGLAWRRARRRRRRARAVRAITPTT